MTTYGRRRYDVPGPGERSLPAWDARIRRAMAAAVALADLNLTWPNRETAAAIPAIHELRAALAVPLTPSSTVRDLFLAGGADGGPYESPRRQAT